MLLKCVDHVVVQAALASCRCRCKINSSWKNKRSGIRKEDPHSAGPNEFKLRDSATYTPTLLSSSSRG